MVIDQNVSTFKADAQRYKSSTKSRTMQYNKFLSALPQTGIYLPAGNALT